MEPVYWKMVQDIDSLLVDEKSNIFDHNKVKKFLQSEDANQRRNACSLVKIAKDCELKLLKIIKKIVKNSKKLNCDIDEHQALELAFFILKLGKDEYESIIKNPSILFDTNNPKFWITKKGKPSCPRGYCSQIQLAICTYYNTL
jgi:hypothetical protein